MSIHSSLDIAGCRATTLISLIQQILIDIINFLCARLGIMIYPTDFIRYPNKFGKNVRNIKISTIGLEISERKSKKKMQSEKVNHSIVAATDESILIRYLNNSTVHGFRYLTDPTIRRTER